MNYPPYDPNNPNNLQQPTTAGPYPPSQYPQFNQQPPPPQYPMNPGPYPQSGDNFSQYPPQPGQIPQYSQPLQPPQYPQPGQPQKDPWYKSNAGIITLLIFFFPAGLYLMWQYAKWNPKAKWIVTGVLAFFVLLSAISNANTASTRASTTTASTSSDTSNNLDTSSSSTDQTPVPTDTPTPSPTPTPAPTWRTTHTYTGNGTKKTETITVGNDWKIQWSCTPSSSYGGEYNVIVDVNNSDGTSADPGVINTICKNGNTSGETEERVSGNVYLDVQSEAAWTMTIQELK